MSLFDIIRYRNTDLTSYGEIEALPVELLELYWQEAHYNDVHMQNPSIAEKCSRLQAFALRGAYWDSTRPIFIRALKRYNI